MSSVIVAAVLRSIKPRIKNIPAVTLAAEPIDVAAVTCNVADATLAAYDEIGRSAEISSPLVNVCVVLSVVFELIYLHHIVSGSPPAVTASAFVT